MTRDLVVGETYSLTEVGAMVANDAAIVPSDRIVTGDLAWERMTVGRLMEWLEAALDAGEIEQESVIWVDSDPEGNGTNPMRAAASLVAMTPAGSLDEDATEVKLPAPGVWFGAGY